MSKFRVLIYSLIILSLVSMAFVPAPEDVAAPQAQAPAGRIFYYQFVVVNNTGAPVGIIADGVSKTGTPHLYKWSASVGKSTFYVEAGVYITTFFGCHGREVAKKMNFNRSGRRVSLRCGKSKDPSTDLIFQ